MRTLTIGKCLPYVAGPAISSFEQARMLIQLGHSVEFLTYESYPTGTMSSFDKGILEKSGVNFHYVGLPQSHKLVAPMLETSFLSKAIKIIQAQKIDVIDAHYTIPHGLMAITLGKFFGIPTIVWVYGSDIRSLAYDPNFTEASRLVFQETDLLFTVSENLRQGIFTFMGSTFQKEIHVLGTSVDTEKFTPAVPTPTLRKVKDPKILYVGRFAKHEKRLDILLFAFKEVLRCFPEVKLLLVGVNSGNYQIEAVIRNLDLENSTILVKGAFSKLPSIYQAADIAVLSSEYEGLPGFLCEAAASGLPIVTTPVGGIPDFFIEGKHCLYARIGDDDDLAKKISTLLLNPELRCKMGQANLELAQEKFDLRTRCVHMLDLLGRYLHIF